MRARSPKAYATIRTVLVFHPKILRIGYVGTPYIRECALAERTPGFFSTELKAYCMKLCFRWMAV
jgi:hypothetical protein